MSERMNRKEEYQTANQNQPRADQKHDEKGRFNSGIDAMGIASYTPPEVKAGGGKVYAADTAEGVAGGINVDEKDQGHAY